MNLPVFTSLGTKNSSGFHIDTSGNPAQDDLIGSPEKNRKLTNADKPRSRLRSKKYKSYYA